MKEIEKKLKEGEPMNEIELKQMFRYLHPLIKDGYNENYFNKMGQLEKVELNKDLVFISQQECHKELFIAILTLLKTAPTYVVIDAYKLRDIDMGKLDDLGYNSLYVLAEPDVLFIKCGIAESDLPDTLKKVIGNCIDPLVTARRDQGKRTFVFSYGTGFDFSRFNSRLMTACVVLDGGVK